MAIAGVLVFGITPLQSSGCIQQESDWTKLSPSQLVEKLDSDKFGERDKAAELLQKKGPHSVPVLFKAIQNEKTGAQTKLYCMKILSKLATNEDRATIDLLKKHLNAYPANQLQREKKQWAKIRFLVLNEVSTEEDAVELLRKGGAVVLNSNQSLFLDLHQWQGTDKQLKCVEVFSKPIHLIFPLRLDAKLLNILSSGDIRKLSFDQLSGSIELGKKGNLKREHCKEIVNLQSLEELQFSFQPIPKGALKGIGKLTNLRNLRLTNGVSKETIQELGELKKLEYLSFTTMANIPGDAFSSFENLKSLKHLDLDQCRFDTINFKYLSKLNLETLTCPQISTNDETIKQIAMIQSLKRLTLGNTLVTDLGLQELRKLPNLESIHISEAAISDRSIETINHLSAKNISFHSTLISKSGYSGISISKRRDWQNGFGINQPDAAQYRLIQGLIQEGFVIRPRSQSIKLIGVTISNDGWRVEKPDFDKLAKLNVDSIRFFNSPNDKQIESMFALNAKTKIYLHGKQTSKKQIARLRDHFETVHYLGR